MRLQPFFVDADGRRLYVDHPGALDFFRGATAQALKEENWELAEALSRETLRGCVALGETAEATLTAHEDARQSGEVTRSCCSRWHQLPT